MSVFMLFFPLRRLEASGNGSLLSSEACSVCSVVCPVLQVVRHYGKYTRFMSLPRLYGKDSPDSWVDWEAVQSMNKTECDRLLILLLCQLH